MNSHGQYECSKCGKWKYPNEFYKHDRSSNGLQSHCKECQNLAVKRHSTGERERRQRQRDMLARDKLTRELAIYKAYVAKDITRYEFEQLLATQDDTKPTPMRPTTEYAEAELDIRTEQVYERDRLERDERRRSYAEGPVTGADAEWVSDEVLDLINNKNGSNQT